MCCDVELKHNWEENRDAAMKTALYARCKDEKFRQLLLSIEPLNLVFHKKDKYWGDGGMNGGGQNQLGKLLMELRSRFKQPHKPRSKMLDTQ